MYADMAQNRRAYTLHCSGARAKLDFHSQIRPLGAPFWPPLAPAPSPVSLASHQQMPPATRGRYLHSESLATPGGGFSATRGHFLEGKPELARAPLQWRVYAHRLWAISAYKGPAFRRKSPVRLTRFYWNDLNADQILLEEPRQSHRRFAPESGSIVCGYGPKSVSVYPPL